MEYVFSCSRARGLWYFDSSINSLFGQNLSICSLLSVRHLGGHPCLRFPGCNHSIPYSIRGEWLFHREPGTGARLCGKPCFALLQAWKDLLSLRAEPLGKDTPVFPQWATPSSFLICLYGVDSPTVFTRKNFNWTLSCFISLTIKLFSKVN